MIAKRKRGGLFASIRRNPRRWRLLLGLLSLLMLAGGASSYVSRLRGKTVRVTIPEGWNRFDIARRLARQGICPAQAFLKVTEDAAFLSARQIPTGSAEGYLFPDTYSFRENTEATEVANRMVDNFFRRVTAIVPTADADAAQAKLRKGPAKQLTWTLHDALILASIVEKEAVQRREQPVVAGVFYNRLLDPGFSPKRLQADPTVAYGCQRFPNRSAPCRRYQRRITHSMLQDDENPYNTYRIEGLPPGPICNPGLSALRATLDPEAHAYLYFMAKGDGTHAFSETLEAHNAAVARYRR